MNFLLCEGSSFATWFCSSKARADCNSVKIQHGLTQDLGTFLKTFQVLVCNISSNTTTLEHLWLPIDATVDTSWSLPSRRLVLSDLVFHSIYSDSKPSKAHRTVAQESSLLLFQHTAAWKEQEPKTRTECSNRLR